MREPLSGMTYPRLVGGSAPLNAALQDRQLEHAANALDCRADRAGMMEMTDEPYELSVAVTWKSARLVSVTERINYYCGGAHPDGYDVGLILDRATGRPVPVAAIWRGLMPARLRALYLARGKLEAECRDVLAATPDLAFTAHLTSRGLALTPTSLPHVVSVCEQTVTLPYATLRTLADPSGLYFRDLYPR